MAEKTAEGREWDAQGGQERLHPKLTSSEVAVRASGAEHLRRWEQPRAQS